MKKTLEQMRKIRIAQVAVRKSLKIQEETNQNFRKNITEAWDDRTRDYEVKNLAEQLAAGRKLVRGYQAALHELKANIRVYNKRYDRSLRHQG